MHRDQLEIPAKVAAGLITALLPEVSPEDIHLWDTSATTQRIVRIGTDLVARFPLVRGDAEAAHERLLAEHHAMDEFAEHCPVPTPRPVAIGEASTAFPMPWSVQTWLPGEVATPHGVAHSDDVVEDLATLITALRSIDTRGRTFTGSGRGGDLRDHDTWVALCLDRSEGLLPAEQLRGLWSRWRELDRTGPDVMSHTDLIPGNLLSDGNRLTGVLDAGGFSAADPALDLVSAWHLLAAPSREKLRRRLGCSAPEWERGAAWAFEQAIGLVWYYRDTNPTLAELGRSTLQRLMAADRDA